MIEQKYIWVSPHFRIYVGGESCPTVTEYPEGKVEGKAWEFSDRALPIRIFQDRMDGWFFQPARRLMDNGDDIAAIHIVTPLIEALEIRYQGISGPSQTYFKRRASQIFGITDNDSLTLLYKGLRCGFAHHGFLKDDDRRSNILIVNGVIGSACQYDNNVSDPILWIDANIYVTAVKEAYDQYYRDVASDEELRRKFMAIWSIDWQMSFRVPGGSGTADIILPAT